MNFQAITILLIILLVASLIISQVLSYFRRRSFSSDRDLTADMPNRNEQVNIGSESENEPMEKYLLITKPGGMAATQVDQHSLMDWYNDRVIKHKRTMKSASDSLRALFFIHLAACLFFLVPLNLSNKDIIVFLGFNGLLYSVPVIIYYYVNKRKKLSALMKSKRYVELNESQFPKIWNACYRIMEKMELSYPLRIFYVKKNIAEATVLLEKGTIYLMLSRGMISYSQIKFKDVESIIGHELGHVCQGDTRLMLISRNAIFGPAILSAFAFGSFYFAMLFSTSQKSYTSETFQPTLLFMGSCLMVLFVFWLFTTQRRQSEYLADMASFIFVEDSTICDLIKQHLPMRGNLSYPSRSRRIDFIKEVLTKYRRGIQYKEIRLDESEII